MIERAVLSTIEDQFRLKPVVLITGARQVGKTTLCGMISKGFGIKYVTLADNNERMLARTDPEMFIGIHGYPLIIDEIQYAPQLFETIESVVDKERFDDPDVHGLFILTGSQKYRLMEGISQSMSGRVGVIDVPPVSISEEYGLKENPFTIDQISGNNDEEEAVPAEILFGLCGHVHHEGCVRDHQREGQTEIPFLHGDRRIIHRPDPCLRDHIQIGRDRSENGEELAERPGSRRYHHHAGTLFRQIRC